jgi:ATP-dependent DNA helicase RecG
MSKSSDPKYDPRKLMEEAIAAMKRSISEPREDGNASPKVGAVLWKPDGTSESACRGELRNGDHAEFTLLERKNRPNALDGCILFATLEPCAPGARSHPKLSCAERIVNARIKEVWVGCQDPHPKVAGEGFRFLRDNGVTVHSFPRELQEVIEKDNEAFFKQAQAAADKKKKEQTHRLSEYEKVPLNVSVDDFSQEALDRYRSMLMGKGRHKEGEFHRRLYHQGLLEEKDGQLRPTGFGMLLFARHPRDVMEQAGILGTICRDGGEEPRDFDGPMVLAPEQAIQWLKDKLPNPISRTQARRKEQNEIYYELVREGLVNALVHRDYGIKQAKIQLVVTPERTVIRSPGKPMEPVTLEQLQAFNAPMFSRNPRLHAVFNTMELAEERGLGLRSMRERTRQVGLALPNYAWNEPYLDLTLYRAAESATKSLDDTVLGELNATERRGWTFIASRGTTTQNEYSREIGVTARTAQRHLGNFVDLGLLRRIGSGPATEYQIIQP